MQLIICRKTLHPTFVICVAALRSKMNIDHVPGPMKISARGRLQISYQDTNYRRSIPAEERLSICLRFLATGDSYRTIAGSFRAGISTVSMLIPDVVAAIWDCLVEEFMAVPGAEEWR
uniref:Transposase Helix-turn-helix domain-containing protein n=1 Tax=Knipowitschia caucasica TaxID=637954 RepID=A0AAV2KBV6_KNICA